MLPAIRVENLSKRYELGLTHAGSIRELVGRTTDRLLGRRKAPLPHELAKGSGIATQLDDDGCFWAIKDVSFEVQPGEVLGIIGRNGAGKSTVLKILSRITPPTKGRIEINGRVASLLEVGTGFHPELTGRENVYLNGAILGMTKAEIRRKFDEIVAFAEIDDFIDTPVKRYSSGMYVRLAFAVAANLDPEILIVDEVLAVGDAEFQKKCIGKMHDVAGSGRTVLFVSHNLDSVMKLTQRTVVMSHGAIGVCDHTPAAIEWYVNKNRPREETCGSSYTATESNLSAYVAGARILTSDLDGKHRWGKPLALEFLIRVQQPQPMLCFSVQILNHAAAPICDLWLLDRCEDFRKGPGLYRIRCEVPRLRLYLGMYTLTTWLHERRSQTLIENLEGISPFEVIMGDYQRPHYPWYAGAAAYLEDFTWTPVDRIEG
jgi:ABC-type polysaccharide/polyol phosphate transport system ATPase subunit